MGNQQNPFDLHSVTPYLVVAKAAPLISFLKEVLGATIRGDIKYRDDQSVMHLELQIGDSVIMMGEPLGDMQPTRSALYVYVPDCDEAFKAALKAGATEVMAPADYPHGDRYGGVQDAAGNTWWLVTHTGKKQGIENG